MNGSLPRLLDINNNNNNNNNNNYNKAEFCKISSLNENPRIILNVGGFRHEVLLKTLNKMPNSRLGRIKNVLSKDDMFSICDDYNHEKTELFFDRDPTLFNYILNYYRIGQLHISDDVCPVVLAKELLYWKLERPKMDLCCEEKLFEKQKEIDKAILDYKMIENDVKVKLKEDIIVNSSKFRMFKNKIWNMVDNSFDTNSSIFAKVIFKNNNSLFHRPDHLL